MRHHEWIPASPDFTEWKCANCGHEVDSIGPPCRELKVVYKMDESDEEHEITCEEIEAGAVAVFEVHNT